MAEEKVLIEVEIDNEEALRRERVYIQLIERQRKQLKERRKELKETGSEEAAKQIGLLTRNISENSKELRRNQNAIKAEDNSINGLRASVSKLTAERNNINVATAEGRQRFDQLTVTIKEQTDQLKELEKAVGDTRRNVGNYADAIVEASNSTGLFGGRVQSLTEAWDEAKAVLKSFSLGLRGLKGAIAATGIGLLLIALSSLVTFFTKTRKGAEAFEKILGFIGGITTKLIQDFASLGEAIFDTFSNPKKALEDFATAARQRLTKTVETLSELFAGLGDIIVGALSFDEEQIKKGADTVEKVTTETFEAIKESVIESTDSVVNYTKAIVDAGNAGAKTAAQNIALRKTIAGLTIEIAKQERLAEQARKERDDETQSLNDRLAANDRVLAAEKARTDTQKALANARIQLINNEAAARGRFLDEELQERAELLAEIEQADADFAGRTTETQTEARNILFENEQLKLQAVLDRIEAQKLAEEEGSAAAFEAEFKRIDAQLQLDKLEATQTIKNKEALEAKLLLLEQQATAERKELTNERIELLQKQFEKEAETANKIIDLQKKKTEAREAEKKANAQAAASIIRTNIEQAKSAEEAGKAIVNTIRDIIKAKIAEAIANSIAGSSTIPFPANVILGAAAAGAFSVLFENLVPSFAGGGMITPSMGVPAKHPSGDNRLIFARTGEVILNKQQQKSVGYNNLKRANIPNFNQGGVVGSITATEVEQQSDSALSNQLTQILSSMPAPVLDYKEFTEFTNNVNIRQNRARL